MTMMVQSIPASPRLLERTCAVSRAMRPSTTLAVRTPLPIGVTLSMRPPLRYGSDAHAREIV
jgi:hypothetical protein